MPVTNEVVAAIDAELEVQRRLTEREEVEMQRHRDLLEAQLQFAFTLQAGLDALRGILQGADPLPQPTDLTNDNGHHQDNRGQ